MATCLESFTSAGAIDNIPVIYPNTLTPWTATGSTNSLFRIESQGAQTITFSVNVSSSPVGVAFTLFRVMPSGSLSSTGTSLVTSPNSVFTFEVLSGTYVICVHRTGFINQTGSIIASFITRPFYQTFPLQAHAGEACLLTSIEVPKQDRDCFEPIFFDLIDGELPPGITLDKFGAVFGELPNLDCLPDALAPSVGFFEEIDGVRYPFGRMWRFKVRIYTASTKPEEIKEAWFCIRVHNNWSLDTDNFLEQAPFEKLVGITVIEEIERLNDLCVPCDSQAPIEKFVPRPLTDENCAPCKAQNQNTRVSLIEIPEELCDIPTENLGAWFVNIDASKIENKYIKDFYESLNNSTEFKILLSKMGYAPEENENEFAIVNTFDNFLQITVTEPTETDPDSYAGLVEQWRKIQNQNLPFYVTIRGGENASITIT